MSDSVDSPSEGEDVDSNELMDPSELLDAHDVDGDNWPESDEFEHEKDRIDRELDKVRARRTGQNVKFPQGIEDYVLMIGIAAGVLFFGSVTAMSASLISPDSVWIDTKLSGTYLDPGEECLDSSGVVWVKVWVDDTEDVRITAYNTPKDAVTQIRYSLNNDGIYTDVNETTEHIIDTEIPDGVYDLRVKYLNVSHEYNETGAIISTSYEQFEDKLVEMHVSTREAGPISSLFGKESGEKEVEITDDDPRVCWTMKQLGGWAWILMGAEWGGGRETAMLAGGSADVPPWWLASVSLMMSVFFLFVQYPLMYRFYHREEDDELSEEQVERVVNRAVTKVSRKLHIEIDRDGYRMQERAISIDVLVPYRTTMDTYVDRMDVRASMTKEVLKEFLVFGIMKPLQLKAQPDDERQGVFESLKQDFFLDASQLSIEPHGDRAALVEDYSRFFEDLNTYSSLEDRAQSAMTDWFVKSRLINRGIAVMSDDHTVFVRVIYKPKQRFAFFRFKSSYVDLQADIENHLTLALQDIIGDRNLVVSARNEVATLSDRSAAGRVETGEDGDEQALVAKKGGITGSLLQNQFMGDILSTVEFVAYEKRDFINRWGFFGLIVFVWIPFMASGVLVGAMLGLLSRMDFLRVLTACLIGGAAASLTWAYTARSIIELMERYHAEAFIPFLIGIVVLAAVFHLRTNKRRRREALFRESLDFFKGEIE